MIAVRSLAVSGVAGVLLVLAAPAFAAPGPAAVVVSVRDGSLDLAAGVDTVTAVDGRVGVRWDTTAVTPGAVFGDVVRLRAVVLDGPGKTGEEPVTVPVAAEGVADWEFTAPGRHTVRLDADAYLLDGSPVHAERVYAVEVGEPALPSERRAVEAAVVPEAPQAGRATPEAAPEAAPQVVPEFAAQGQPPTATGRVTLDRGHVDALAPRLLGDGLSVHVKDGSTVGAVTWREPADVEFRITDAARTALPAIPALSFLGAAGAPIHLLPQQEQPGILWIGWSTEELRPADVTGPVTWTLTAVDGPGPFGLFTTGSFGAPSLIFNSTDGLPDTHTVALGTHAHANWAFGKPGRYRLDFTVSATRTDGRPLTDTESYTFVVGDAGATGNPDTPDPTPDGRRSTQLASTGPAEAPAATALALALLATGALVLVVTRRRPAKESS
ncbi:choice-of-anchor M domain-containing protein [Saccharothrix sp. NRRL B-16348]|uniref:choice-of-anchor M domain-containing protein n=1 Tax=Saccharothrix sp. NRRL B-16348 TaxID=1415542 RepID=UPI0006AFDCF1|nr:choice-of-anchor M domain-containing protein [Saccharothrix sp. NRRL B-16348]